MPVELRMISVLVALLLIAFTIQYRYIYHSVSIQDIWSWLSLSVVYEDSLSVPFNLEFLIINVNTNCLRLCYVKKEIVFDKSF